MRTTIGLSLGLLLAACGGTNDTDAGALDDAATTSDAGGTDAGATDGGGTDAGGGDAGARDAGAVDAGGTDAGVTDAGDFDAGPAPTVTLSDVAVYSNCMPIVAPDPVLAFWNVTVAGATGTTATLTDAKLTLTGASVTTQTLTVDVPSFALTGGAGSQMQRKTSADVLPPGGGCGELCGGATFSLELTYDIGGRVVVVTESGSFGCVY